MNLISYDIVDRTAVSVDNPPHPIFDLLDSVSSNFSRVVHAGS